MAQSYEALIQDLRAKLDSSSQAAIDLGLSNIRRQGSVDNVIGEQDSYTIKAAPEDHGDFESITYVGKASDIHFIHTARRCMQGNGSSDIQSYSRMRNSDSLAGWKHTLLLPSREEAVQFLEIYLSTIHLAYPFLHRQTTLDEFEHLWTDRHNKAEYRPWLALFSKDCPYPSKDEY